MRARTKEGRTRVGVGRRVLGRVHRHLPVLDWLPRYSMEASVSDLVAGLTLGLTMMPQSIAYAQLAGVRPEVGLYSAFMGGFVYLFLGTIKQVAIGPASIMAIITMQFTRDLPVDFVHLLTLVTGAVQLAMALLGLGFLVDFISAPVVSAFTSATSIIIMVAQLKPLLGLSFRASGCLGTLVGVASRLGQVHAPDALLGGSCMLFLTALKAAGQVGARLSAERRSLRRLLWLLSIGANALCITAATVLAANLDSRLDGGVPFAVVGHMPAGLPKVGPPAFSATVGNLTYSFTDMLAELGGGVLVTPVVAVLVNVAIGKAFAVGGAVDATQELLALAACNLVGSMVQAMPVAGALTRSAVAQASDVRSPLAGLYCSALIVLALACLTPYFFFIPRTALAAVLIVAVTRLIDVAIVPRLWRTSKRELAILVITFSASLWLGVEVGLLLGMVLDALRLMQPWTRPPTTPCEPPTKAEAGCAGCVVVHPCPGLLYPGADAMRERAARAALQEGGGVLPLVLDCRSTTDLDYTAALAVEALQRELAGRGQGLVVLGLPAGPRAVLVGALGPHAVALCDTEAELPARLRSMHAMQAHAHAQVNLDGDADRDAEPQPVADCELSPLAPERPTTLNHIT